MKTIRLQEGTEIDPARVVRDAVVDQWERRSETVFERWYSPGFVNRTAPPGVADDLASFVAIQRTFLSAFGDTRIELSEQVTEGDRVTSVIRLVGVHHGEFLGVAATGKTVVVTGMRMDRVGDERIVEHWAVVDMFGLMRQIASSS